MTNYPICMAARSVLLSGQYNRTCTGGVENIWYPGWPGDVNLPEYPFPNRPHLKDETLPEVLRRSGYYNATIGKWHIHSWPQDIGFDYYLIPRVHHCHTGQSFTENGEIEVVPDGYSVDFEAERVEALLHERSRSSQPFFLYYNISPPHCPLADAPERYLNMYRPEDIPIRSNVALDVPLPDQTHAFKVYRWDFRYYHLRLPYTEHLPCNYSLRHLIAEYYGMTTWVDDTVGRLLRSLDSCGLAENTIIVFVSDHGDNLGSHGLVQKGTPNDESLRIPWILRLPERVNEPEVIGERVASLVDVMPTVLDLLGIGIPDHVFGRSLAPLTNGACDKSEDHDAFVETRDGVGVRTPRHLYFLPWQKDKNLLSGCPSFFYDTDEDPFQLRNLVETCEQKEILDNLHVRLSQWNDITPWTR